MSRLSGQCGVISRYIHAKDHNRPHLMAQAFTADVHLEMQVKTAAISFPAATNGLEAVTDVLVSRFGATYENVYTFCLSDSLSGDVSEVSCNWLVAMTEKANGNVRVGCGRYDWSFTNQPRLLVKHLLITIEEMVVLEPDYGGEILDWVSGLSYPWCRAEKLLNTMPDMIGISPAMLNDE